MIKWKFERKWADKWIGVYHKQRGAILHVWICIIPCFPLHLEIG